MNRKFYFLPFLFVGVVLNAQKISMLPGQWDIGKFNTQFFAKDGADQIRLERGTIWEKETKISDGVIEVDLSVDPEKSSAGVCFRGNESGDYEVIYLRVPLSGREDAIQYAPSFHNEVNWQLYPEHQAKYEFPTKGKVHMKIVLRGNKAELYMDTMSKAILTINNLRTRNLTGKVGLTCLSAETFSNLRYTAFQPTAPIPIARSTEAGLIDQYLISQPLTIDKNTKEIRYPSSTDLAWKSVYAEEDGLLNISRFYEKKLAESYQSRSNDLVWLKKEIHAETESIKKLNFDFSNRVWIFLNGKLLYFGDRSFRLKGPLYQGSIDKRLLSDVLYLPFRTGENELLIAVSAVANGWGFISKIE